MRKEYKYKNATVIVEGEPNMDRIKAATKKFLEAVERERQEKNIITKK